MKFCRSCNETELSSFVDLGITPLSNSLVPFDQSDKGEISYPLHAFVCDNCFLVQLGEFESPAAIFSNDYVYFSSFSKSWLDHAKKYSEEMTQRFSLGADAHIAEVASNDGYLLQWFEKAGQKVTGIEPAANCAQAAREIGVTTINEFFGKASAQAIAEERGQADLIAANNVLAHVPELLDFTTGFRELLKPQGVVTFEFPHLQNLIELCQFDTIYHEHFSYLSLAPVKQVLENSGLRIFDVEKLSTHGGSLRVFVCHANAEHTQSPRVEALIEEEKQAGLYQLRTYRDFDEKVLRIKDDLLEFLIKCRRDGKSVAAYGAAAKGSTLLNYCGVGPEYIPYIVDLNNHKQNRYFPGVRIPVLPIEHLLTDNPDYIIILPWNLREEIAAQLRTAGIKGRFVTAIPNLQVEE